MISAPNSIKKFLTYTNKMLARIKKITLSRASTALHIFVVTKTYSISIVTVFTLYAEYAMISYCNGIISNRFCHR